MFACILQAVDSRNAQKSIMLFKQNRISTKKSSFRFYPRVIWKQIFKVIFIIMECFCQYNKTFHIVFKKNLWKFFVLHLKFKLKFLEVCGGGEKIDSKKIRRIINFQLFSQKSLWRSRFWGISQFQKNGLNDYRVYRIFQSWKRAIRKLTFEKSTWWEEHFLSSCK